MGDVESMDLPYSADTFDCVLCSEVLEHLANPEATLRKLVPLLKPGGRVYASVPNVAHWKIMLADLAGK
jgi:2-polyprenyl-3-methyl-5-hydroxy-6-metoxy-1,4-benzoquinol methylase